MTSLPLLLIARCGRPASYFEFARADLGEQITIYLRPQRWLPADLGSRVNVAAWAVARLDVFIPITEGPGPAVVRGSYLRSKIR